MNNKELKQYAKKHKVYQYQIAEYLDIQPSMLSMLYRKPLNAETQESIIKAVDSLSRCTPTQGHGQQAKAVLQAGTGTPALQPLTNMDSQVIDDLFGDLSAPASQTSRTAVDDGEEIAF